MGKSPLESAKSILIEPFDSAIRSPGHILLPHPNGNYSKSYPLYSISLFLSSINLSGRNFKGCSQMARSLPMLHAFSITCTDLGIKNPVTSQQFSALCGINRGSSRCNLKPSLTTRWRNCRYISPARPSTHNMRNLGMAAKVPDTQGMEEEDTVTVEQLTPHDQWQWNSQHHWKHWHGLWSMWQPAEGSHIVKVYKSVRSLWGVDSEKKHLYHRNQWYDSSGEGPDINWEGGPWAMYELKHSLPDGIWHPNSIDHRIIQFPNGDLGWVQLALKPNDPKSVVFNEMHFMGSPETRAPVIIGYDFESKLGVALMLEETRDNDKRPEPSWQGTLWKHHRASLEETRTEPEGTFVGTEITINTHLQMSTRKAIWKGFGGGLTQQDEDAMDCKYILIHLPCGFTAFAPRQPAIGKAHAYYVSWVVNEDQVRVMSTRYFDDGRLEHVKSGSYNKSA